MDGRHEVIFKVIIKNKNTNPIMVLLIYFNISPTILFEQVDIMTFLIFIHLKNYYHYYMPRIPHTRIDFL